MNKQDQFVNWICGKTDNFPFFKTLRPVRPPDIDSEDYYGSEALDIDIRSIIEETE